MNGKKRYGESHTGRFQMANKGTLFLDETSNISLKVQATLLRVIQEQEIPRVGSSNAESVNVRLIAAKTPAVDANSGKMTLVDVEREHIEKALRYFDFQINKTAQFSGIEEKRCVENQDKKLRYRQSGGMKNPVHKTRFLRSFCAP